MQSFVWPVRVYYEDTDALGVVYYANYLKYMERARTEWLRSLAVDQARLRREAGLMFLVRQAQVDYRRPARLDDRLTVISTIAELRRVQLTFQQRVVPADDPETTLVSGRIQVACARAGDFRPAAIPASLQAELIGES